MQSKARSAGGLGLLFLLLFLPAVAWPADPGDSSLGADGTVLTNIAEEPLGAAVRDIQVDNQGRVVLLTSNRLIRLTPSGDPDTSFSKDGIAPLPFSWATHVALYGDGRIVLAAQERNSGNGARDLLLARYLADGNPDLQFGEDGLVAFNLLGFGNWVSPNRVFVQSSGDIVAFVSFYCSDPETGEDCTHGVDAGVLIFGQDGQRKAVYPSDVGGFQTVRMKPDDSFVALGGGQVLQISEAGVETSRTAITFPSRPYFESPTIAFQSDEGLVYFTQNERRMVRLRPGDYAPDPAFEQPELPCAHVQGSGFYRVVVQSDDRILLAGDCGIVRLNADGSIDDGFGSNGLVSDPDATLFTVDQGTRVVRAGWADASASLEFKRYLPDGEPDPTFGVDGVSLVTVFAQTNDGAAAAVRLPSGGLVAGGISECLQRNCTGFALARYLPDGALDRRFGGDGTVVTRRAHLEEVHALLRLPDGSLIAGGRTESYEGKDLEQRQQPSRFALVKYRPSGRVDRRFGDDGIVVTHASAGAWGRSEINALGLQNGKIVVAGLATGCNGLCFTIARYHPDGKLDRSFGGWGPFQRPGFVLVSRRAGANALVVRPDGRILVTGGGYGKFILMRLMRNGGPDRTFGRNGIVETPVQVNWHLPDRGVTDLSREPRTMVLGPRGAITLGGGGAAGRGLIIRYRRDGTIARRFGRNGRVKIWSATVGDLMSTRCGLVAVATVNVGEGVKGMGYLGIDGRKGSIRKGRIRVPFGDMTGTGSALVRKTRSRAIAVGGAGLDRRSGDFALSRVHIGPMFDRCR